MKICIASDHAAYSLKKVLTTWLAEAGHEVVDLGPESDARVDYPTYAFRVGRAVVSGDADRGILACGTGIGMSIAANKVAGVRAALVHDAHTARLAAEHNDANVLCLGARLLAPEFATDLVEQWLTTPFESRHRARLDMIHAFEDDSDAGVDG